MIRMGKIKKCVDAEFNGVPCLESEEQFGFFKDNIDKRPSSCVWIDKNKLYHFFGQYVDVHSPKS